MLHLSILLDEMPDVSLQQRAELFLECFGNLLVREKTRDYIKEKASELIRFRSAYLTKRVITDGKGLIASIINFSALKFRERDDIEFVFKFWRDEKRSFDSLALLDYRMRKYLGKRFDSKENIVDWDYNMKLLDRVRN
jgi:dynein assembly factor 3